VAGWIFFRVREVNPAILGDEYLYSINARHAAPWDPSPAGDFSNYLFNVVYSSTNLCGANFYACGKLLNLGFFIGFLIVMFVIALRFLNYWVALAFTIAAGLSPISVYTSMFLPESMYFFMISLVFLSVLRAAESYSWWDWGQVGLLIGIASLVKPHAWLSAIAVGVFLVVLGLTQTQHRFRPLFSAIGAVSIGAILGRLIVGFAVAGPRAFDFFGSYINAQILGELAGGVPSQAVGLGSSAAPDPMNGVVSLFPSQLNIHVLTLVALMGISIIGLIVGIVQLIRTRVLTPVTSMSLLVFIWLVSLTLEIIMFTGWITGGGEDHSSRVLSRYYDFLFVFVPLAGLVTMSSKFASEVQAWIRIPLAGLFLVLLTPAFTGFFSTLEIQIADAPNLGGLVVNMDIFNAVAMIGFLSLVVFAFQPRLSAWAFVFVLPATMIATGFSIQGEYQRMRAELNPQDLAGQYLNQNLTEAELEATWIVGTSRFQTTNVAIWADSAAIKYQSFSPGTLDTELIPAGIKYVLTTGGISMSGDFEETIAGDGYFLYKIK